VLSETFLQHPLPGRMIRRLPMELRFALRET
jgi:hypothetical protein